MIYETDRFGNQASQTKGKSLYIGGWQWAVFIDTNGSKGWRYRYQFAGKTKMISLDTYPVITLTEARAKRDETRKLVANGINSSEFRKAEKISVANLIENTFRNIACEWYEKRKDRWAALPTQ
ncbi:hypothetical protein XSR1_20082 [Xenorhabdus szentirmaii DSM 16338]|uniref:Integrase DNA-binding domain-containing protein n=1 Tax=Xenorhabdus szentirmaii DSM 16338 TaxID=1427518 RepID=W1IUT1_9GAMM|nr:hypothetical protein XSR1_20082 [Xenorhabdus szentirmaii DSM 16338]